MVAAMESHQSHQETFDEDYFMRGRETGKSNYENYSWKRDLTVFCAARMALYLGCERGDTVLDYGCSRGFYVRALRMIGFDARGFDISKWAIANCDPEVEGLVGNDLPADTFDWIFCKDVLEHIPPSTLLNVLAWFLGHARKGAIIIVPLGSTMTGKFMAPQDNEDKTHVNCWDLETWLGWIQGVIDTQKEHWVVQGGYKLPGVKEACDKWPGSVAFITLRKLNGK